MVRTGNTTLSVKKNLPRQGERESETSTVRNSVVEPESAPWHFLHEPEKDSAPVPAPYMT